MIGTRPVLAFGAEALPTFPSFGTWASRWRACHTIIMKVAGPSTYVCITQHFHADLQSYKSPFRLISADTRCNDTAKHR